MASLVLGIGGSVIGTIIGGPIGGEIGGAIGAAIGGLIDNMLFPTKTQGPRVSDLSVQASTLGNVIAKLYGPENRSAGNVIYSSGLIEHAQTSGGKGGPTVEQTSYTYTTNIAVAICDASRKPIEGVQKIWMNSKLVYSAPGASGSVAPDPISAKLWSSMTVYDGSFTQLPDPNLEGVFGVGQIPAYRGIAYVVIWDLLLTDFGNRLPDIEFLTEADESITVQAVLRSIITDCGIDPNTVSSSGIEGDVRGYAIGTTSSGTAAIQPLALVYNFDSCQVAGALRFVARGAAIAGTIDDRLLAGHASTDDRPEKITWQRAGETNMPQEATVTFADPARDFQANAQTARRVAGSAQNNLQNQVPVVVDVATGAQLADRMLWEAWNSRDTATTIGDDRLIDLEPGRVYLFPTPAGVLEPLRLKTKQRGANGVVNFELLRDRAEVYQSTAQGTAAPTPPQTINVPEPTSLELLDCPLLADADDDTGFYFVVDGQDGWRGCYVMRSTDGGATYNQVDPAGKQSVIGTIDGLGDGPTEVFDNVNKIRVYLDDPTDELESISELDLLNGNNVFWIGDASGQNGEILQARIATLIDAGVYDLSCLLRGRLGTEYATGTHGSGERLVLLQRGPIYRVDYGPSDWNSPREYKAVTLLLAEADAEAIDFTNTGEGKRPLSPVQIFGTPSGADTIVTWSRRSRLRQPGLGNGPLPLGESVEAYEIDVIVAGDVVRTISTSSPEFTYTAADRAADAASGDMVRIAVYQMSDVRGRGRPGFAEI